jgi:hypothetical protein
LWDQSVHDSLELLYPYNTNARTNLSSSEDGVIASETQTKRCHDSFFSYFQLSNYSQNNFLAGIALAVNTSQSTTSISTAAEHYASGEFAAIQLLHLNILDWKLYY